MAGWIGPAISLVSAILPSLLNRGKGGQQGGQSQMAPGMGAPEGYSAYTLPTMGGGQQDIYNMLKGQFQGGGGDVFQRLLSMAQGKGDAFQQMEIPARRELEGNLANIGMQFGLSGANKSSGFQNAIAGAGQQFGENLYGQRANLMQNSMRDVLNLGNTLLGTPTQQFGLAQNPTGMADFMKFLGNIVSQVGGTYLGNKFGGSGNSGSGGGGFSPSAVKSPGYNAIESSMPFPS